MGTISINLWKSQGLNPLFSLKFHSLCSFFQTFLFPLSKLPLPSSFCRLPPAHILLTIPLSPAHTWATHAFSSKIYSAASVWKFITQRPRHSLAMCLWGLSSHCTDCSYFVANDCFLLNGYSSSPPASWSFILDRKSAHCIQHLQMPCHIW